MNIATTAQSSFDTLVVGLGKTGLSCVRYLAARGERVAVTDSRAAPPGLEALSSEFPELPVSLGGFDPALFAAARRLILSPGVPRFAPLIAQASAHGIPVIGDVELFVQAAHAPICAITGSNGKSTVTTLVGLMARQAGLDTAVGGNLGQPALELLDPAVNLYVLELSSFQLESTPSLAAEVAVALNVSPDHLDRYPSFDDYAQTKARIYQGARIAVINRDDPQVCAMPRTSAREIGFTLNEPRATDDFGLRQVGGTTWICQGAERLIDAAELALVGRHNLANALAALALASACGLPLEPCCEALRAFAGLPHRSVLVTERHGVRWIDDSKGTNPGATIAALDGLVDKSAGKVILIAGGEGKGADFSPLRPAVMRAARAVVLIGRDAPLIERVLQGAVTLSQARDMDEAVAQADELAQPGDCVLLSPACASFDLFTDYAHRGEVFAAAVRRLSP